MPANNDNIERGANIYDVVIKLIDVIYKLIDSGRIVGLIIILLIMLLFLIVYKLPAEYLNTEIGLILSILKTNRFYIFPLSVLLGISIAGNYVQGKIYKAEIKRLARERDFLMFHQGKLTKLRNRSSSNFDLEG